MFSEDPVWLEKHFTELNQTFKRCAAVDSRSGSLESCSMVTVPLRFHFNFRPTAVRVILGRNFRFEQKLTAEMLHVIV